eukprot:596436-Ditylum_brightwellii.AAC.1
MLPQEEADMLPQEEADRIAKEEADRLARVETERLAQEEAKKRKLKEEPVNFTAQDIRFAAARGNVHALRRYLNQKPEWIDASDSNGWCAIHEGVRIGHVESIKLLIEFGCDVNARTGTGNDLGG